jgi:hypothetical protein
MTTPLLVLQYPQVANKLKNITEEAGYQSKTQAKRERLGSGSEMKRQHLSRMLSDFSI